MATETGFRLYRDTEHAVLAGVCAGIADYLGVDRIVVRLAAALCLVFFFIPTGLAYVVLAMVLKRKPPALFRSEADETFWREVANAPGEALRALRHRLRGLDERTARMEALITSNEFQLRRDFRDIGG